MTDSSLDLDIALALDAARLFERAMGCSPLPWQREYLRARGNVAALKGRQVGASTAAAALAIHEAAYGSGNAVIVSPSQRQSSEIIVKARAGVRALGHLRLTGETATQLRFASGNRVLSLPGTASSVRGWTASLLILDESAWIGQETWTAALALVATGGRTIVQSTPAAAEGPFAELVTGDDPAWTRIVVRSDEAATVSRAFLAEQKRRMQPEQYAAEFEAQFLPSPPGIPRLFDRESIAALFEKEDVPA